MKGEFITNLYIEYPPPVPNHTSHSGHHHKTTTILARTMSKSDERQGNGDRVDPMFAVPQDFGSAKAISSLVLTSVPLSHFPGLPHTRSNRDSVRLCYGKGGENGDTEKTASVVEELEETRKSCR